MQATPPRIRRVRRTDFTGVMTVLAATGRPVPPPDRTTLRRFRRIAADLGGDLYVALDEEQIVGFVHVTYARQVADRPNARVESLAVHPNALLGAEAALLELAVQRARRRGCARLLCCEEALHGKPEELMPALPWVGRPPVVSVDFEPNPPGARRPRRRKRGRNAGA